MAHFFLHCAVALELWSLVFCLFGVSWVMPNFMMGLLSYWKGQFDKRSCGDTWKAIPLCLMGCIWR
jgi:hypothetical protein